MLDKSWHYLPIVIDIIQMVRYAQEKFERRKEMEILKPGIFIALVILIVLNIVIWILLIRVTKIIQRRKLQMTNVQRLHHMINRSESPRRLFTALTVLAPQVNKPYEVREELEIGVGEVSALLDVSGSF